MNYKFLATQFGEGIKYDSTINEINRIFYSLTDLKCKDYPNEAITSARSALTYSWVMTVADSELNEEEKIDIIRRSIDALAVKRDLKKKLHSFLVLPKKVLKTRTVSYVSESRIKELKSVKSDVFDLIRLIRLCEELNTAYENNCYYSVAMVVRSILDHIPPIFNTRSFSEIANNYRGTKSFREQMKHLENSSRKIADSFLHTQVRKKEVLPGHSQIDFSNDLDVLLAEVYRLLK
ncbi:MAG TPA: hypothetical protein VMW41_00540 [Candidatus Bathyarchaeia archaeon]|nr:hypothetical protein [Candidatus Bathyarchaeia archaeon]